MCSNLFAGTLQQLFVLAGRQPCNTTQQLNIRLLLLLLLSMQALSLNQVVDRPAAEQEVELLDTLQVRPRSGGLQRCDVSVY